MLTGGEKHMRRRIGDGGGVQHVDESSADSMDEDVDVVDGTPAAKYSGGIAAGDGGGGVVVVCIYESMMDDVVVMLLL